MLRGEGREEGCGDNRKKTIDKVYVFHMLRLMSHVLQGGGEGGGLEGGAQKNLLQHLGILISGVIECF